ncbi:acylphosphatase [Paraferrimonas sedimenticola]|uniref:acylphosphatase n=1 Tax=Paraferrimonas sedimenticola TaxID=375674 RepID=A0AA37RU66_9GAMM|nr:acylphosphatase [Paraferrimonas sedimenticola]GLP94889.1 acylphosphatase [Paraferrimonas sedimenticola]
MQRCFVRVSGKVQGVWYRASAKARAQELGLTGYVKNLEDGQVALVLQGAEPAVAQMLDWCAQGPEQAKVDRVFVDDDWGDEIFLDFSVED